MHVRHTLVGVFMLIAALVAMWVGRPFSVKSQSLKPLVVPTLSKLVESEILVSVPNQEHEVRFRIPELVNSDLVAFQMVSKSCSCMDGYTGVDDDAVPVAVLKLRLMPNRHLKEGTGIFRAQTAQGEFDVRVQARINVFPPFWTKPDDVRVVTLAPGETERSITLTAGTAAVTDLGDEPLVLMPLPSELTLVSSTLKREKLGNLWVSQVESEFKYKAISESPDMRPTRIVWKTPSTEYEKSIYWTSMQGIVCRPSHLFIKPRSTEQNAAVWDGEVLVASAVEAIRIKAISSPDAAIDYICESDKAERQAKVRLTIALKNPSLPRLKLNILAEGISGRISEVGLPVFVSIGSDGTP